MAHRLLLLLALFTALGVRLYRLGAESLWYDETVSVVLARASVLEMIAHTARDIHPPGYYLVLHGWQALSQPSLQHGLEFLFAWPSLLFGVLVVALIYPLGHRLLDRRTALLATWIAALHPHHVWYSQEVRMYTLGAMLGLLCLWLLLRYVDESTKAESADTARLTEILCGYALCAAMGLYTLYYFLFLLIAINCVAVLLLWVHHYGHHHGHYHGHYHGQMRAHLVRQLGGWIAAQFGALLLWAPWLPVFWHQATDPPVPVWRVPWRGASDVVNALAESAHVLWMGESFPKTFGSVWLLLIALLLFALYGYAQNSSRRWIPVIVVFLPLGLIVVISSTITPLYHVRYLYTYAPLFSLVMAAGVRYLLARTSISWKVASWSVAMLLLVGGGWSLYRFWHSPLYRADDHRGAVAQLAQEWRPGDAILVNAGWIYTVLEIYWPTEPTLTDAVPPKIGVRPRLSVYAAGDFVEPGPDPMPVLVRSGSVDGPASLGWGNEVSDFYSIGQDETQRAITQMAAIYPRIWHYRLYDTVNDPTGVIRSTLAGEAEQAVDTGYAGRDFLRVQRFDTRVPPPAFALQHEDGSIFSERIMLALHTAPETVRAGTMLYVTLEWSQAQPSGDAPDINTSLRLYDETGSLWAQADAPLTTAATEAGGTSLALPVPLVTAPGGYSLELVLYSAQDGAALSLPPQARVIDGQQWRLNRVEVEPGMSVLLAEETLAQFDYITLISAALDREDARTGDSLTATLLWYPQKNAYRDTYDVVFDLRSADGTVIHTWTEWAGTPSYPSGDWLPQRPLRDNKLLTLPASLPTGTYEVTLRLQRSSDAFPVPARVGWLQSRPFVSIGTVVLE